jgi:hypothetical protein
MHADRPTFDGEQIMTLTRIAEEHRVSVRRDECGDQIIPGKRGHLYVDGAELCAMWRDARPMNRSRLVELGGKLRMGDISVNQNGRRVQDAWVKGISPDQVQLALPLVGAKRRRILSATHREALVAAGSKSRFQGALALETGRMITE